MKSRFLLGSLLALTVSALAGCGGSPTATPAPHHHHTSTASSTGSPSSSPSHVDPLTGLSTSRHGPLIAVMVENSEYGRPQYGLSSADVVYEAYTENFYYSRFMLLFYGHAPQKVGPVRSARPYFVSWVHDWNAAYAHAGGSSLADAQIIRDGLKDMDKITKDPQLYWRNPNRSAPHNLFTNVVNLMHFAQHKWGNPAVPPQWSFTKKTTSGTPPYQTITLTWNTRNTMEQWRWNASVQGWDRWVDCPVCSTPGYTQVMGLNSQKPVVASNVIIQYTTEWLDMADPNTADRWILMHTHGTGKALLFLGHRYYQGTWSNAGPGQPTKFFLANGQPAQFQPGQTWIEVVPANPGGTPFHLSLSAQ